MTFSQFNSSVIKYYVPDTTPAPEIMYQYAQGVNKGLTATKKQYYVEKVKPEDQFLVYPPWNEEVRVEVKIHMLQEGQL